MQPAPEEKRTIPVKVCFRNIVKRFDIDAKSSFANLQSVIGSIFKIPCHLKYQDNEFDMVLIENDADLWEAIKLVPSTGGMVKLFLEEKSTRVSTHQPCTEQMPCNNVREWLAYTNRTADNLTSPPELIQRSHSQMETASKPAAEEGKLKNPHKKRKQRSRSNSVSSCSSNENDKKKKNRKVKKVDLLYKKMQQEMRPMMSEYRDEICSGIITSLEQHQQAMSTSVSKAILGRLEGAVIHSLHQSSPQKEQAADAPTTPPKVSGLNCKPFTPECREVESGESDDDEDQQTNDDIAAPAPLSGCRMKYHHQNVLCDCCEQEIFGPRYKCGNCSDYDLCERCESIEGIHYPSHVFLKLHYPCPRAGRAPAGAFLGPLMRTNVYEEWENVREKEVLLQKILDSSSEAESVTLERIGKKNDDPIIVARRERKAEWKRLKKEARKSKKQICRKMKQLNKEQCQETIFQQTCETFKPTELPIFGDMYNELQIAMEKSFEQNNPASEDTVKTDSVLTSEKKEESVPMTTDDISVDISIVHAPAVEEMSLIEIPVKADVELEVEAQVEAPAEVAMATKVEAPVIVTVDHETLKDENIETALEALKIVDAEQGNRVEELIPEPVVEEKVETTPEHSEVELTREESLCSPTTSEDFIVVAKCFDTTIPLDDEWVAAHHANCTEDHDCARACHEDFVAPQESLMSLETKSTEEAPVVEPVTTPAPISVEHATAPAPISVEPVIIAEPSSVVTKEPTALTKDWDTDIIRAGSTSQGESSTSGATEESIRQDENSTLSIEDIDPDHPDPTDSDMNGIRIRRIVAMKSVEGATVDNQASAGEPISNQLDPVIQSQIDEFQSIQRKNSNRNEEESSAPPPQQDVPEENSSEQQQDQSPDQQQQQHEQTWDHHRQQYEQCPPPPAGWSNQFEGFVSQVVDGVTNTLGPYFNGGNPNGPNYPPSGPNYNNRTYAPYMGQPAQGAPMAVFQNGAAQVVTQGSRDEWQTEQLQTLTEMGFCDIERNRHVLRKYNGNVQACIGELLEQQDNEWHQNRH